MRRRSSPLCAPQSLKQRLGKSNIQARLGKPVGALRGVQGGRGFALAGLRGMSRGGLRGRGALTLRGACGTHSTALQFWPTCARLRDQCLSISSLRNGVISGTLMPGLIWASANTGPQLLLVGDLYCCLSPHSRMVERPLTSNMVNIPLGEFLKILKIPLSVTHTSTTV